MHGALRPTRGAAAAIARWNRRTGALQYAGIGNIAATIVIDGETRSLVSMPGILGHGVQRPRTFDYEFPPGALLVMHSDGLRSGWDLSAYPGVHAARPARDRRAADPRLRARARRCERGGGARMSLPIADEVARVDLRHDEGVVTARQRARDVAELLGFDRLEQTRIATAVSELARNAHRYAGGGEVRIRCAADALRVEVVDSGPGIPNLDEVLRGEYTSSTGLGRGLVGVRQLMDEFVIDAPGRARDARERGQAAAGVARCRTCAALRAELRAARRA